MQEERREWAVRVTVAGVSATVCWLDRGGDGRAVVEALNSHLAEGLGFWSEGIEREELGVVVVPGPGTIAEVLGPWGDYQVALKASRMSSLEELRKLRVEEEGRDHPREMVLATISRKAREIEAQLSQVGLPRRPQPGIQLPGMPRR